MLHEDRSAGSGRSPLDSSLAEGLRANAPDLRQRYGDLENEKLLGHMAANKAPSRKEMVALASAARNYVRAVDNALLYRSIVSQDDLVAVALQEIRHALLGGDGKELVRLWGKDVNARLRRIKAILEQVGFTLSEDSLPIRLPDSLLEELASQPAASNAKMFLTRSTYDR